MLDLVEPQLVQGVGPLGHLSTKLQAHSGIPACTVSGNAPAAHAMASRSSTLRAGGQRAAGSRAQCSPPEQAAQLAVLQVAAQPPRQHGPAATSPNAAART